MEITEFLLLIGDACTMTFAKIFVKVLHAAAFSLNFYCQSILLYGTNNYTIDCVNCMNANQSWTILQWKVMLVPQLES